MFIAYIVATLLAAAANLFSASCDFVRYEQVSIAMAKAGVPKLWMMTFWSSQSRGRARIAARHRRASDRNGRRTRTSFCFSSAPSSSICAHTTTCSAWRSCSFSLPLELWHCDRPRREPLLVQHHQLEY